MSSRPSAIVLIARMFGFNFVGCLLISLFWNTLSGMNMFPFEVVFWVAVILTVIFVSIGWATVTVGSDVLLKDDPEFQRWKQAGGRPYWDSLPSPINPATPIERITGLAEPRYTDFAPPADWVFQCPKCGARCEKEIDICWRCFYGLDGDSTAYYERWGGKPDAK